MNPGSGVISGLSLLFILTCSKGFSLETSLVFPCYIHATNFPDANLNWKKLFKDVGYAAANSNLRIILLFYFGIINLFYIINLYTCIS